MLRYKKFLESIEDEDSFEELKKITKNVMDHINMINEVIIKWQDEFEFSYGFNDELWFYSRNRGHYIYVFDNDGQICLDEYEYDGDHYTLLEILSSVSKPPPIINYMVNIDSSVDGVPVNNIIKEIKKRYPFVRIEKVGSPSNCEMQFEANINDINDAI